MDRARADDDKHSIIVACQYACGVVTSGSNSALRLWSRANFMAKEGRLDERVILGAYSQTRMRREKRHTPMTLRSEIYFCMLKSSSMLGRGVSASARGLVISRSIPKDPKR